MPSLTRTRIACVRALPFALWLAARNQAGLPVAVVNGRGVVVQANRAAQAGGVVPGLKLAAALSRCPELHHVPFSAPRLAAAWEGLLATLSVYSPRVQAHQPGLAWLTLTEAAAREVASALGVAVGLADSQEASLLAAAAVLPGEVAVMGSGTAERASLGALPLDVLLDAGLSPRGLEQLRFLGLRRLGELLRWSQAQQRAVMGSEFPALRPFLSGPRTSSVPLYRPSPEVSATLGFDEPLSEPRDLLPVLDQLAHTLHERLAGRQPRRLTLRAESLGLISEATREGKETLMSPAIIARLAALALQDSGAAPLGIERLTLSASGLQPPARQGQLWGQDRAADATEAVLRRFPTALVQVAWRDVFAYASDQRYSWVEVGSGQERPLPNAPQRPTVRNAP